MKTAKLTPYHFFLKFAGWGYDPAKESKAAGRARCAKALAEAERQAKEAGVTFDWSRDDQTNRSFTDEGPEYQLWQCFAMLGEKVLGSLGGVDFGETGEPWGDTYARVVEAEIASEIDFEAVYGEDKAGDVFATHAAQVGIDWGVDGCFVVNARNAEGDEILSSVFPGRGSEVLEKACALARLLAEASGGADVVGPAGLVEAVKHPGGVRGVLGLDAPGAVAVPLGFSDPVATMGAACQASNDATKHLRVDLGELLKRCLGFIEGFEDDDTQGEGEENVVPGLLADLRALTDGSPAVYVDEWADNHSDSVIVAVLNPKGEAVSVDVLPPGEVSCDFLRPGPDWKRVDVPLSLALASRALLGDSLPHLTALSRAYEAGKLPNNQGMRDAVDALRNSIQRALKGGSVA
jgi:hypothetical protein